MRSARALLALVAAAALAGLLSACSPVGPSSVQPPIFLRLPSAPSAAPSTGPASDIFESKILGGGVQGNYRASDPEVAAKKSPSTSKHAPVGGHNRHVYVIGDSVLLGTTETMPAALKGWRVTMNCMGDRRLPQAIDILRHRHGHFGAVVVIQMGNNYIAGEDGSFAHQINVTMHILRKVRRVVWVTVASQNGTRNAVNKAIRAAPRRFPTVRVADWQPITDSHKNYTYDGLHLTPAGRLHMAALVARTVGPPPPKRD